MSNAFLFGSVLCLALCSGTARGEVLQGPLAAGATNSGPRDWAAGEANGSVHCLGNGRLCVYGQGPNIIQLFGPSYSTTTIGGMALESKTATCVSRRVPGAAIWEHRIRLNGAVVAVITDFVDSELPCFIRHVNATVPITFVFRPEAGLRVASKESTFGKASAKGSLLVETPIGRPCVPFGNYPIPFAFFHQFTWRDAVAGNYDATRREASFVFGPGQGTLFVTGGPELDACLAHMDAALDASYGSLLTRTRAWWADFTAKGRDFGKELPPDIPQRERLVQVLDDTAVQIKAQQAAEGGVLAGYPYHLGYVRDQYGTARGLAALGHLDMCRDILDFYFRVFDAFGAIHNAQAFGIPGLFHVHENDEVEITGYITLQAFDYLARTGDVAFLKRIFPMLDWAWTVQQRNLVKGMLPFNGDETYVAGGLLPRSALNDGSAEATMLFVDSGAMLADFAEQQDLWDQTRIEQARQVLQQTRDAFRVNFWRNERLITNNPERCADDTALPKVRHGVCESCVTVQWTLRTDAGRYVCTDCLSKPPLPKVAPQIYTLQSVSLTPLYFHSPLFKQEELRPQVEVIVHAYQESGKLPSRPDSEVSVGYDYGLVLYALTELGDPRAKNLYEKTLSLADDTGAWAEYYRNHEPFNTRCRPWESAINVEALLHWIEKTYGWE